MKRFCVSGSCDKDFLKMFSEFAKYESENKSNALIYPMNKHFRYDLLTHSQTSGGGRK